MTFNATGPTITGVVTLSSGKKIRAFFFPEEKTIYIDLVPEGMLLKLLYAQELVRTVRETEGGEDITACSLDALIEHASPHVEDLLRKIRKNMKEQAKNKGLL